MFWLLAPFFLYALGAAVEAGLAPPDRRAWAPAVLYRRLALGLLLAGWGGTVLAELGRFDLRLLTLLLLAPGGALLAGAGRRRAWQALWSLGCWPPWRELVALGAVLALAAALFAHPGEDILGARDPGIYFATGIAIARHGALLQEDPALRALAADLGESSINYWLFQSVHGWPLRFPGQLFVRDLGRGQVEPGFLPWYPVAVAAAVSGAGPAAGLWVNPVLAVLAVLAVYLTGRALCGPLVGALGAALLAVNLAQVWFARYTMAEPAAQWLVWTGLYALVAASQRPSLALGVLAGLAWGSAPLARVDTILLLPGVAAYLAWQARTPAQRPGALIALVLLGLGGVQFGLHAWLLAPGYTSMVFSGATLAAAAGGIAALLTLAGMAWGLAVWRPPLRREGWIALASVALALVGLLAYSVRPSLPLPPLSGEARELEVAARESLVRLGWYVTPLGLALALGGAALLAYQGPWRAALPLLGLLVLSLAFYLPNPLVSSDHPWAARRYLPLVLPGLLLLAAHGAVGLGRVLGRGWRRGPGVLLAGLLVLAVASGEWRATAPIADYREHAGALEQVWALAALVPAEAIVLFPRSAAGMRLSLPLHYLGNRATFVLPATGPEEGVMAVVRRWREAGIPVYWVVPQGTRFPTPPGVRFVPTAEFTFETRQLERPTERLPQAAPPLRFPLQLYRVELAAAAAR
ncbi:MAG TPA: glycosyltransferase family 39 protein [Chloroflexota bacterium]|nr:glycosyltransferase family 39 protein [Chloroflexota bacterium]